jgi:hypothetical protein
MILGFVQVNLGDFPVRIRFVGRESLLENPIPLFRFGNADRAQSKSRIFYIIVKNLQVRVSARQRFGQMLDHEKASKFVAVCFVHFS